MGFSARPLDRTIERFSFEPAGSAGGVRRDSYFSPRLLARPQWRLLTRWLGGGRRLATGAELDSAIERFNRQHLAGARSVDRLVLLAFDEYHDDTGRAIGPADRGQRAGTDLYVSNSLVRAMCREQPDRFLFGASIHPYRARDGRTALEMLEALGEFNRRQPPDKQLQVRIGVNTGKVVAGNMGSVKRMEYSVLGDTVNLGSRLEGLNKTYGTSIIISRSTAERLDNLFVLRELDKVMVKGKEDAVTIFELMGFADTIREKKRDFVEIFTSALTFYRKREWDQAQEAFKKTLRLEPEDKTARLYLDRISSYRENPPPPEWDGVTVFTTK